MLSFWGDNNRKFPSDAKPQDSFDTGMTILKRGVNSESKLLYNT